MNAPNTVRVWAASVAMVALLSATAAAQGRPDDRGPDHQGPPGQQHRHVSPDDAIVVTRDAFAHRGYQVDRIENKGPNRIVYYRRVHNGRPTGRVLQMVIRPQGEQVVFDQGPTDVVGDIRLKLNF